MAELPQQHPGSCSELPPSLLSTLIDLMCPMEKYSKQGEESSPPIENKDTKQNTQLHRQSNVTAANIPLFPEILENKSQSCGTSKNILDLRDRTVHLDNIEIPKKKRKSKYSDIVGDLSHLSREPRRKRRNRYAGIHSGGTTHQYQNTRHYAREHPNYPHTREHPNYSYNPYCNYSGADPSLKPSYSVNCTNHSPAVCQSYILSTADVHEVISPPQTHHGLPKGPHRSLSSSIPNAPQSTYSATDSRSESKNTIDESNSYLSANEAFGAESSKAQRVGKPQLFLVRKLIEILMYPKSKAHQNCVLAILREDKNIKDLFIQEKVKLGLQVVPVFRKERLARRNFIKGI